jgi:uncharacterized membrane protein YhdT
MNSQKSQRSVEHRRRRSAVLWLLLLPFVGLLFPPYYNRATPQLFGFPFFYWYQLLWVPITVALIALVYGATRHDD